MPILYEKNQTWKKHYQTVVFLHTEWILFSISAIAYSYVTKAYFSLPMLFWNNFSTLNGFFDSSTLVRGRYMCFIQKTSRWGEVSACFLVFHLVHIGKDWILFNAAIKRRSFRLNLADVFKIIIVFLRKGNCANFGSFQQGSNQSGSSAGCSFLMWQFFIFSIVWNWRILCVGGSFFESLNLFLQQRVLYGVWCIYMVYCICSRWCFHIDIIIVPLNTCRKVTFSDDVARN